jgi:hypothetical protein
VNWVVLNAGEVHHREVDVPAVWRTSVITDFREPLAGVLAPQ